MSVALGDLPLPVLSTFYCSPLAVVLTPSFLALAARNASPFRALASLSAFCRPGLALHLFLESAEYLLYFRLAQGRFTGQGVRDSRREHLGVQVQVRDLALEIAANVGAEAVTGALLGCGEFGFLHGGRRSDDQPAGQSGNEI